MSQLNLIVLDTSPYRCAQAYSDADVVERPMQYVETLQLAYEQSHGGPIKSRHVLARWAQQEDAWWWLYHTTAALLTEQQYRFGEMDDDAWNILLSMVDSEGAMPVPEAPRFVQLLEHKIPGHPIEAYRKWYHGEAEPSWTRRGPPDWWRGSAQYALQF